MRLSLSSESLLEVGEVGDMWLGEARDFLRPFGGVLALRFRGDDDLDTSSLDLRDLGDDEGQ